MNNLESKGGVKMERLTERTEYGIVGNNDMVKNYPLYKVANSDPLDHNITEQAFEKLAEYEDLEEQGLLLRLPCSIGTKVYVLVNECEEMYEPNSWYTIISEESFDIYMIDSFGKEVFLTQEEAEQKLKEMKGD